MGLIELIIVVLLLLWLFGYFGRGRLHSRGPAVGSSGSMAGGNWVHILLVLVVILIVLRLLQLI